MMRLPKLILASASPRRSEILTAVGWEFEKCVADVDESEMPGEKPEDYVKRLALEKAEAAAKNYESGLILGADTIVVIDDKIIGKPKDSGDARRMLRRLSGKWHEVFTGVALVNKSAPSASADGVGDLGLRNAKCGSIENQTDNPKSKIQNPQSNDPPAAADGTDFVVDIQKTAVKFADLSDEEIEFLIEKGEPLDKAGAYAVQAQAALFIEEIKGDYWNVVGLPVSLVYEMVCVRTRSGSEG